MADQFTPAPVDWAEVEHEATATMVAAAEPVVRKAAEDFYAAVLDSVHDYLAENARFNLASELKSARADAHAMRMRNLALAKQVEILTNALRAAKRELTIPAAEHVPAIPDVWAIIDRALEASVSVASQGE